MMKRLGWFGALVAAIAMLVQPAPAKADLFSSTVVALVPPLLLADQQSYPPGDGYIWEPGYWAWSPYGQYYWVPGEWVLPPQTGYDWTPGYWASTGSGYDWNPGYWGTQVGYYGGVNYGYGYYGNGYVGGRWYGHEYRYNRAVTRVNEHIRNVYDDRTVVVNNYNRTAYNGGNGIHAHPTAGQQSYARQRHVGMTAAQQRHVTAAVHDPNQRWNGNRTAPAIGHQPGVRPQTVHPQVHQQVTHPQVHQQTVHPQVHQQVTHPVTHAQPPVRYHQVQHTQPVRQQPARTQPVRQPQPARQPQRVPVQHAQPQRAPAQHAQPKPAHSHGPSNP